MMNPEQTRAMLLRFATIDWIWKRSSIKEQLGLLGWTLQRTVGHRDSYSKFSAPAISVYHDGSRPETIEVTTMSSADFVGIDGRPSQATVDEFRREYRNMDEIIRNSLGEPLFSGGPSDAGFPGDQDAVLCALWNTTSARIMLQLKHEDSELPVRICIVVAPDAGDQSE